MVKNIMCVCASRDTTDIGFYSVEVTDSKIDNVKLENWIAHTGINIKETAKLIQHLCSDFNYDSIIFDVRGFGIAIVDELEKEGKYVAPIYKAKPSMQNINSGIDLLNYSIGNNKLSISKLLEVNISDFRCKKLLGNGMMALDVLSHEKEFSNMVMLFAHIKDCVLNSKRIQNKTIIEKNLREILEILIDDLNNADKSNIESVNSTVRLIDKVNYIRGQY